MTCILIHGCSKYIKLIEPHLILLRKYWIECNYPVFVGMDNELLDNKLDEKYNFTYIKSDLSCSNTNMSNRLLFSLKFLKDKFKNVILMLDDNVLVRKVNHKDILEAISFLENDTKIGCLRLYPSPPGHIGYLYKSMKFRGYYERV